jgi:GT2 family glycosyltransferase
MEGPWLSAVLSTYNGSAYLESALESLVLQQDKDFEVIALDDGSTDATMSILRRYSTRLAMTIVKREHSGNWVANTNIGLAAATGRYLCWFHQDDTWCPDRVAKLKRLAGQWPDALLLVHSSWFIDAAGHRVGLWRCPFPRKTRYFEPPEVIGHLLVQNSIASTGAVFKAEAARQVGGLDEQLWYTADWDFWLKIAKLGHTVYYPAPLGSVRLHRASQTITRAEAADDLESQYACVLARHLGDWERSRPDGQPIGEVARFSASLNLALLKCAGGRSVNWFGLLSSFILLGPRGWHLFLRDSRIVERATSRFVARLRLRGAVT